MKAVEELFPVQGTGFDNLVILIVVPILVGRVGRLHLIDPCLINFCIFKSTVLSSMQSAVYAVLFSEMKF